MDINRAELKRRAQVIIRDSKPKILYAGLIYLALAVLMGVLSAQIVGISVRDANQILQYLNEGDTQRAMIYAQSVAPSASAYLLDTAMQLVLSIVGAGFIIFLLNTIRSAGACYGNLLDGFGFFWRVILLNILEAVFITLWSMLLVIPGIIAAYRYRQAIYLLLDHPDWSALDCIRESKRIMLGRKAELFILDLSFIGWMILAGIPYVGYIVQVWTFPYINTTYALYYMALTAAPESRVERPYENPPCEG